MTRTKEILMELVDLEMKDIVEGLTPEEQERREELFVRFADSAGLAEEEARERVNEALRIEMMVW